MEPLAAAIKHRLTNEERDINREIKSIDLSSGEEANLLGELIFDDASSRSLMSP